VRRFVSFVACIAGIAGIAGIKMVYLDIQLLLHVMMKLASS
jgi:hypothetical protein